MSPQTTSKKNESTKAATPSESGPSLYGLERELTSHAKKPRLFLWFSTLSLLFFIGIGYAVLSTVRPAITNFVVTRQEADTVIFANRLANSLLLDSDFKDPNPPEVQERFSFFLAGLQIPARLSAEVTDREGRIIAADQSERVGERLDSALEFQHAKQKLLARASFRTLSPSEKETVGTSEVFELYIPVTFGISPEVAGVVHSLSRIGFLQQTARSIEEDIAVRIGGGFVLLYFAVATIVWGASKTIRRQSGVLAKYAINLESMVRARTRELQAVFGSVAEGIVVIGKDFRVLLMNRSAQELLEVKGLEVVNQKWTDIVSMYRDKKEMSIEEWATSYVLKSGKTKVFAITDHVSIRYKGGKALPVVVIASPLIEDKNIEGVVLMFRDISDEIRLEEARIGFISTASHQLRTPLTSIRWSAEMLQDKFKDFSPEHQEFISNIYQSTLGMVGLLNLLLLIGRLESGRVKIEPVVLSIKDIVKEFIDDFGLQLGAKKQTVKVTTVPDPFPGVPLDKIALRQVFQNLISNASQYSLEDKEILVSISADKDRILCAVKDEGIGIPQEQQKRIFEKFFRADNALRMAPTGSGLGLSLVKLIVTEWGGEVWFESIVNKGSTFYFTIPASGMKLREGEVGLEV